MSDWAENLQDKKLKEDLDRRKKATQVQAAMLKDGIGEVKSPFDLAPEMYSQGSYLTLYIRRTGEDGVEREQLHSQHGAGKHWTANMPASIGDETYKACSSIDAQYGAGAVMTLWALAAGSNSKSKGG